MRNRLAFPLLTPSGGPIHFRVLEEEDIFTPLGAYGSAAGLLCSGGRTKKENCILPTTTSHHVFCLVLIVSNPLSSISLICPRGEEKKKKVELLSPIVLGCVGRVATGRDPHRASLLNSTSPHFW